MHTRDLDDPEHPPAALERCAYVWDSAAIIYGGTLENLHLRL
jgi:hypothetical protein